MNTPHDSSDDDPTDDRQDAPDPDANLPASPVRARPLSTEAAEAFEAHPYWVPAGVAMTDWSPALRAEVAAIINPTYRELVLSARPGLAQSTGITIVHLLWLEILDHLEIGQKRPNAPGADVINILCGETRTALIDRHLRLVEAKFKASDFLLRLQEFKARRRSRKKRPSDVPHRNLAAIARCSPQAGKNDFC